jgi:hypothetical protein
MECGEGPPTQSLVHRATPSLPLLVRNSKGKTSLEVEQRGLADEGWLEEAVTSAVRDTLRSLREARANIAAWIGRRKEETVEKTPEREPF